MKKATRILIKNRPDSIHRMVLPLKIDGALPKHCYDNSAKLATLDKNYGVLSGWLVGDYFGDKGTAIIPHYWVEHRITKQQFDVTPIVDGYQQTYDYVEDLEIFDLGKKENYIPASLNLTKDGKFKAVTNDGKIIPINSVDLQLLYSISARLTKS